MLLIGARPALTAVDCARLAQFMNFIQDYGKLIDTVHMPIGGGAVEGVTAIKRNVLALGRYALHQALPECTPAAPKSPAALQAIPIVGCDFDNPTSIPNKETPSKSKAAALNHAPAAPSALATPRNLSSASSRLSTTSAATSSGGGRRAGSSRLSSFSQKMSRLTLSRASSASSG